MIFKALPQVHLALVKAPPFGDVSAMPAELPPVSAMHTSNPHAATPSPQLGAHAAGPDRAGITQRKFSTGSIYHPERKALHDRIIDHHLSGAEHGALTQLYKDHADPSKAPRARAIFTMGGSGSGKSYYAKQKFLKHPRFALIDPDSVKKHLPEYNPTDPEPVHEESSDVAKRMQDEAHKRKVSYVYDGTGANASSFSKKIQSAKDAGYHVEIHRASVPLDVALARNAKRERKMPEHIVRKLHSTVEDSFHKVKHLADKVRVIDTSQEAKSPFAVRRQEILSQKGNSMEQKDNLEKSVAHSSHVAHSAHSEHVHHYHPVLERGKGLKKIEIDIPNHPPHFMLGEVKNGHIIVKDVVHDGVSEHAMTEHHPALKPIALKELEKRFPGQVKVSDW